MPETRPTIGDFRTTPGNTVRDEPVATVPDTRTQDVVVAETVNEMKAEVAQEEALSPAERYQKRLEQAKISVAEATSIYDSVLMKGYYEQYVRLGKAGRAVFRTRLYDDALRLQTALETQRPQLNISQDDIITRYNLASSLYEWQGKPIPHETEADFDNAMKLIRKMPAPVYSLLAGELAKFDTKVLTVFSEGASENFS